MSMNRWTPSEPGAASEPGTATRERLLDAGERLFAEHGFLATSVRDITTLAECNVAAVNYHFGGKDNLYREVFRRRLGWIREQRLALMREALDSVPDQPALEAVVRTIATAFLRPLVSHEPTHYFLELWSRELLERRLPPELFQDEILEPTATSFIEALRRALPDLDIRTARMCVQSIIGQLSHATHMRRFLDTMPSRRGQQPSTERLIDHVVRFSVAGIEGYAQGETE